MKPVTTLILALALFLGLGAPAARAAAVAWEIDTAHSSVGFKVKHMVVSSTAGRFATFSGSLQMDDADVTKSAVSVDIDAASINTDVPDRDKHLRTADFFDVEKFPKVTFKSTKVEKATAADRLKITGDLTLHGVTKPVVLDVAKSGPVKDPWGNTRMGFSATTQINRKDFGLTWSKALETGGLVVAEQVDIALEIEAIQPKPKDAAAK